MIPFWGLLNQNFRAEMFFLLLAGQKASIYPDFCQEYPRTSFVPVCGSKILVGNITARL